MFDPKTNKFPYPMDTGTHYLEVKKDNGTIYDNKYPYIDTSKKFKRRQFWFRLAVFYIARPIVSIRLGLKINGKKKLKQYKEVLDKGVVSVSNHVHMWDYLSIMCALSPRRHTNILSWDKNISGENGKLIRMAGGIPVPNQTRGFVKMAFDTIDLLKKVDGYMLLLKLVCGNIMHQFVLLKRVQLFLPMKQIDQFFQWRFPIDQ